MVSICAGRTIQWIDEQVTLGAGTPTHNLRIVRVMPNVNLTVGEGCSGVARGKLVSEDQMEFVKELFSTSGVAVEVGEEKLNAITGLSGSGPAYVFYLMEAMIEVAQEEGLSYEEAHKLTVHTVIGAGNVRWRVMWCCCCCCCCCC